MGLVNAAQSRVTVSFWFFALAAACALTGQDVCGLLLAAAIHETGHLAAMACCGGRVERFELGAFGAKILPRYPKVPSAARELAVLSAGPAAGIAAGAAAALLGFWRFAEINWFLSGFNLLPLPGLDGGSILSLVLCALFGERGERAAGTAGLLVSGLRAAALLLLCFTRAAI